jgi:hypothetical protein
MDVSISLSGFTTNYKFSTWTPEFGKFAKYNVDRLANFNKSYNSYRQDRRSRTELRPFEKPFYKEQLYNKTGRMALAQMGGAGLLGGQPLNLDNDNVGPDKKKRAIVNMGAPQNQLQGITQDYANSYACSPEQIFTPVETKKNKPALQGNKPSVQKPKKDAEQTLTMPDAKELDPYHSRANDFNIAVHGDNTTEELDLNLQNKKDDAPAPESIRTMGIRAPAYMSGWGYGYDFKKAPYKEDTPEEYPEDIGSKRQLWKTGPVDLRWDELRKVWGPGFDFIEGRLDTEITPAASFDDPTEFTVSVYKNKTEYDYDDDDDENSFPSGKDVVLELDGKVKGYNRDSNFSLAAGSYVMLIRINYEWRIINYWC